MRLLFFSLEIYQHHVWNKTISVREEFHSCHFYHTVKAGSLMKRIRTFTHTPHIKDTLVYSSTHFVWQTNTLINAILATVTTADTLHWITKGVNAQAAEKCHHLCFLKLPVTFWIHFKFSETPQIWERLSLCSWPWRHWAVFERATQSPEWRGHQ